MFLRSTGCAAAVSAFGRYSRSEWTLLGRLLQPGGGGLSYRNFTTTRTTATTTTTTIKKKKKTSNGNGSGGGDGDGGSGASISSSAPTAAADHLVDEVLEGQRGALARSITLVESTRSSLKRRGQSLLEQLLANPETQRRSSDSFRIGISGPPGVGKSTLIEALGMDIIERGHQLAVLVSSSTVESTF